VDEYVRDNAGWRVGSSKMTASAQQNSYLRTKNDTARDDQLNGVFRVTPDGFAFFLPNEYDT